jgi:hypothetical protein
MGSHFFLFAEEETGEDSMPETVEFRSQLKEIRQRLFTMLAALAGAGADFEGDSEEAQMRRTLWACVRELDLLFAEPPPEVDLTAPDAATQRRLYEFVVGVHFTPALAHDPGDVFIPHYTPEEAGLGVYFEKGRWFATWLKLEEDASLPEAERRELVVIERSQDESGLVLQEV